MSAYFSKDEMKSMLNSEQPWMAHGVPIDAMEMILNYCMREGKKHIAFIVVEEKTGKLLDPDLYKLYMEAIDFDGNPGMLERFPPVVWP